MKKLYLLFSFFLLAYFPAASQILINEVSSAGVSAFTDEDGEVEDWIEFYNAGSQTVNLLGYKITVYQDDKLKTWIFPEFYLPANERVTIFFSGKNRRDYFDHWEVPVYPQSPNKYFQGNSEPPSNWRDTSFNDLSWSASAGSVGYGDGDDVTTIGPVTSLYQRYSFVVPDTSKIVLGAVLIDFDDAFVAYLNGKELARFNVGAQGFPPAHTEYAFDEHEAQQYQNGGWSGLFFIPGDALDTIIRNGLNVFSVQTHNFANGMDDLTMIPAFLIGIKDTSTTFFTFPADIRLHTDFDLSSGGQLITLYTPQGQVTDQQSIGPILMEHSRGRQPDGAASWCLFDTPTPDTVNYSASCFAGYGETPSFSLHSGFYSGTQLNSVTANGAGTIYWTNDGADPIPSSNLYSGAVSVSNTQVLRARLYPSDPLYLPGPAATASYLIDEDVTLPVVCINTDPRNLFDPNYGIYVLGNTPDTTCNFIPFRDANFWQGWVRPAEISYFDVNRNLQFEQPASIRIQGNWSKIHPQKGFFIDCDENYRGKPIEYRLFPDKQSETYSGFNIRNAGSDYGGARMRDMLLQKSIQKSTDLDMMDGFPCVLFLNGEFWGVYELREKQDKHYVENNSLEDKDNIDFLQFDGDVIEGDNKSFFRMVDYISTNDMTQQTAYDSASAMLDISNFCDYFITETYAGNLDWLGTYTNNIKFWAPHDGSGKWRYILWDADISFQSDTVNQLAVAINPPTANPHSMMLNALLDNDTFRSYFINRYADLLNTTFYNMNMVYRAEDYYYEMLPEMAEHFALWGTGNSPYSPTCIQYYNDTDLWRGQVDGLEYLLYVRPYYVRNQIQSQFAMEDQEYITLNAIPAGAGSIHLNTITPDSLPWTGIYFDGNPITMTAIPAPGYKFMYWDWDYNMIQDAVYPNPTLTINPDTNMHFYAHFAPLEANFNVYPNPFNDQISLYYEVTDPGIVSIRIYDVSGRLVNEILPSSNYQEPGVYTLNASAEQLNLVGGMYFFELRAGSYSKTVKMISTLNKH